MLGGVARIPLNLGFTSICRFLGLENMERTPSSPPHGDFKKDDEFHGTTSTTRRFKPLPFDSLVGGHQQPLKGSLNDPKQVTKNQQTTSVILVCQSSFLA